MSWLKLLRKSRNDSYIYDALPGEDFIRVLELKPGKGQDKIRCKLKAEQFEKIENTYEAISYAWGDLQKTGTEQIICNHAKLSIGQNLADALRRCRDQKEPRRLWADAICIDQANDPEKGHQVKLMGQIYERAKQVLVWLGQDPNNLASDSFKLIDETVDYLNNGTDLDSISDPIQIDDPDVRNLHLICTDMNRWKQVEQMVALPWFKRLWVVQETSLAKNCQLMWGKHQMSYFTFIELNFWVTYLDALVGRLLRLGFLLRLGGLFLYGQITFRHQRWQTQGHSPLIRMVTTKGGFARSTDNSFIQVLRAVDELHTSDPRDYIFSLLENPLCRKPNTELIIEPDYTKSVDEVYLECALALLAIPNEAKLLLYCVAYPSQESFETRQGLSWVPYWNRIAPEYAVGLYASYKAGGLSFDNFKYRVNPKSHELVLSG
jgi:hypothetical protein